MEMSPATLNIYNDDTDAQRGTCAHLTAEALKDSEMERDAGDSLTLTLKTKIYKIK